MSDRALTPDEQLLQEALRQADPVPGLVIEHARSAYRSPALDVPTPRPVVDDPDDTPSEPPGRNGGG